MPPNRCGRFSLISTLKVREALALVFDKMIIIVKSLATFAHVLVLIFPHDICLKLINLILIVNQ